VGDRSAPGFLTPFLARMRVRAALPHVRGSVLDHGCGFGALAPYVPPAQYLGFDINEGALEDARARNPSHRFTSELPVETTFDTVVSMAVIEHVDDPAVYLRGLTAFIGEGGRVVLTTPRPSWNGAYALGARLGLFSVTAHEEHRLVDKAAITEASLTAGLRIVHFGTFLVGANQLAVLQLD
jgi:2-polyprenyl-3-methyl-5-hydroxy-6-metoxy-1,4-benzoquinol methylase